MNSNLIDELIFEYRRVGLQISSFFYLEVLWIMGSHLVVKDNADPLVRPLIHRQDQS